LMEHTVDAEDDLEPLISAFVIFVDGGGKIGLSQCT